MNGNGDKLKAGLGQEWLQAKLEAAEVHQSARALASLHPAWRMFIAYCSELCHGEIEQLKIQDGLPVLAEVTRKKVKFAP